MAGFNGYRNKITARRAAWAECEVVVRIGELNYEADVYGPEFYVSGNPLPQRNLLRTKKSSDHAELVRWAQYNGAGSVIVFGYP